MKTEKLTKAELELLKHALYMHREYCRSIQRSEALVKLCREPDSPRAKAIDRTISFSLRLDDKLTDLLNAS